MNALTQGALALQELVERFAALSESALRACEVGDTSALASALDTRELVAAMLTAQVAKVHASRNAVPPEQSKDADALLAPIARAVHNAALTNDALLAHASQARQRVASELDTLRRDHAASTAYATTTAPGSPSRGVVR